MRKVLASSLTALLLTGVAVAPLATGFTILTADAAYAKSDKAKGGGSDKAAKGKSGEKGGGKGKSSASRGKGKDPVSSFFNRLTGRDKSASGAGKTKTVGSTGMHPSELGNMNGALNANINAVLAHVRNGNTNGPVGVVAALAVANSGAEGAAEALATPEAGEYAAVNAAVAANEEYETIEDYLAAKEAGGEDFVVDEDIENALANVGTSALNDAVDANADYASATDYFMAKIEAEEAGEDFVIDEDIEAASAALGTYDGEVASDLADAEAALEAKADAEADILSTWNKNTGDVEKEEALIGALNERLEGYEDDIAMAIEEGQGDEDGDGEGDEVADDDCAEGEDCDLPDDEDMAAIVD